MNKKLLLSGIISVLLLSMMGTYAYYTATASNNNIINATAANAGLQLTVTKSAGGDTLVPQLTDYLQSALTGTNNNSCIDAYGNTACQVYTITIKNTGNANAVLSGTFQLTAANMANLKWEELSDVKTRKAIPNTHPKTDTSLANSFSLAANASKTFYVAIWISETGTAQNSTDYGSYNGIITFSYANGQGVTSNFGISTKTLNVLGISLSNVKTLGSNYWTTSVTDSGVYSYVENGQQNYFYRGQVNNNWVLYGGIYWRIVRITEEGEIRMIYSGTTAPTSETQYKVSSGYALNSDAKVRFNSSYTSAEYAGYQYTKNSQHGKGTDSSIKTTVDTWYTDTLSANYETNISTSDYCYDRTTYSGTVGGSEYSGTGVGRARTWFSATHRLLSSSSLNTGGTGPQIYCSHANDNYSLKAGLLSADEAAIAGLRYGSSNDDTNNYLYGSYWLGSPFSIDGQGAIFYANVFIIKNGYLEYTYAGTGEITKYSAARPVISLNAPSGIVSGTTGTYDHPYEFTW